jgi:hypothetical protein
MAKVLECGIDSLMSRDTRDRQLECGGKKEEKGGKEDRLHSSISDILYSVVFYVIFSIVYSGRLYSTYIL